MNYAIEQRLRLIDFLLKHYGSVNREAITDYFGIAQAQVTRDIAAYNKLAPNNALLNQSTKRWVRSDSFKGLYA
jgi:hypothetical protein